VATVLHVSPHPDDEALGAPATLLLLRAAGWRVVNLIAGLGVREHADRRRAEAIDAAARAGFELELPDERGLVERVVTSVEVHAPTMVMSPSPHDGHPTHETVGRVVGDALASLPEPPVWWQWGLWADLRAPTLYVPFGDDVLAAAQEVLAAYAGELTRNDYSRLLDARVAAHAVLGSERVFGFGSARASTLPYAELLTEQRWVDGAWRPGDPRLVDPTAPLSP
jgi:LmbE family N-acetylglucosaminyl deacetylase